MSNFILIFVCTGNICRSPMAEGIMKDMILDEFEAKHEVIPIEVLSAGTYAFGSSGASEYAIEVADRHGINLSFHRSRPVTEQIVKAADLILTMEINHTEYIKRLLPGIDYVYELKSFDRDEASIEGSMEVIDPIGMDIDFYTEVFDELHSEIMRISKTVFSLAREKYRA